MAWADLEVLDDLNDAFEEEVPGQEEGEGEESVERVHDEVEAGDEIDDGERTSQMTPPVVWVLKAKTRWVKPLTIMGQPKMRVRAKPDMDGIKMANNPARMSRTLRAMDQLMALGARLARVEGVSSWVLQKS